MPVIKEYNDRTIANKLKPTPSYYLERKKQEEERQRLELEKTTNAFVKCLKFYEENYPNSKRKIIWDKKKFEFKYNPKEDIHLMLLKCSESDLYELRNVILYNLKEHNYGPMIERDYIIKALNVIIKKIPGGKYLEKIDRMKRKQNEQQLEIEKLENKVKEEKKIFQEQLQKVLEKDKKKEINEEGFICETCGKVCQSKAGLTSHQKTHET